MQIYKSKIRLKKLKKEKRKKLKTVDNLYVKQIHALITEINLSMKIKHQLANLNDT